MTLLTKNPWFKFLAVVGCISFFPAILLLALNNEASKYGFCFLAASSFTLGYLTYKKKEWEAFKVVLVILIFSLIGIWKWLLTT